MLTHYFKTPQDTELKIYSEPRAGVWTHVVAATEDELTDLIKLYALDASIVEDIKDFFEVPRFEQEGTISYFFTRFPCDVPDLDIDTAPVLFILGDSFLLTISVQEVPFLDSFIAGKREVSTIQNTKLFLEMLSELMLSYEKKLTRMRRMVYRDMGRVRSIRGKDIQRLVFLEQELNEMITALAPMNVWLNQLTKGNYLRMFNEDQELLEDLIIESNQLVGSAQSILKTIQNVRGASEAILTQNLNHTIRLLTAITIVLTIPTLISSLFGMNVDVPLQDHPYAFWLIIVLIVTVVALTLHFFRRNRWM